MGSKVSQEVRDDETWGWKRTVVVMTRRGMNDHYSTRVHMLRVFT